MTKKHSSKTQKPVTTKESLGRENPIEKNDQTVKKNAPQTSNTPPKQEAAKVSLTKAPTIPIPTASKTEEKPVERPKPVTAPWAVNPVVSTVSEETKSDVAKVKEKSGLEANKPAVPTVSEEESESTLVAFLAQQAKKQENSDTLVQATGQVQQDMSEAVQTEYFNRNADKVISGQSRSETSTETHPIESNTQETAPPMEEQHHAEHPRKTLDNKYRNKEALRDRLWLRKDYKPIIAYVGRLDSQKGVPLIHHAIFYALAHNSQFVLLGSSPERSINDHFWHLKHLLNDNPDCHLEIGFNEELSHLIYAGSDMIIMPSMYEPCGLAQMIALKYGTVPIVRSVGGLRDTIFDRDYSDRPIEQRNGYVFHNADRAGIESALERAIGLWFGYPEEFRKLIINGMKFDYSWNYPGQHYVNIYEYIRCK